MICASCAAPLSGTGEPCPWCGAPEPAQPAVPAAARTMAAAMATAVPACEDLGCPAGHGPLSVVRLPSGGGLPDQAVPLSLGGCSHCWGLFVGRGVLDALLTGLDPGLLRSAAAGWRPCPVCATTMTRRQLGSHPGLIVEICPDHGLWLEADELAWWLTAQNPVDEPELLRRLRAVLTPLAPP